MKQPTLKEGIVIALLASFIGSIGYLTLSSLFSDSFVVRFLISSFSFLYLLYLLSRSKERMGRFTTVVIWAIVSLIVWISWPAITLFVLINLSLIWLVRSLYFYSSVLSSLADLLLNAFSMATAVWAFSHTSSLFLAIWCFSLVQALFVLIPHRVAQNPSSKKPSSPPSSSHTAEFQQAYHDAKVAVQKLSNS